MPDDDWALGQNEVDVRNEARNPLNRVEVTQWVRNPYKPGVTPFVVFACNDPEQAWIDEQAENAAHRREDESPDKEKD